MTGHRVRVVVPAGCKDPWIVPKDGWEGRVVAPAADLEGHYLVMFLLPWCPLKITRIMPGSVLREAKVVKTAAQMRLPIDERLIR